MKESTKTYKFGNGKIEVECKVTAEFDCEEKDTMENLEEWLLGEFDAGVNILLSRYRGNEA